MRSVSHNESKYFEHFFMNEKQYLNICFGKYFKYLRIYNYFIIQKVFYTFNVMNNNYYKNNASIIFKSQ